MTAFAIVHYWYDLLINHIVVPDIVRSKCNNAKNSVAPLTLMHLVFNISGPNKHTLTQIKDAVHDGLRAVKNAIDDGAVVPGAGAFEIAVHTALMDYKKTVKGRARLGIQVSATFRSH